MKNLILNVLSIPFMLVMFVVNIGVFILSIPFVILAKVLVK